MSLDNNEGRQSSRRWTICGRGWLLFLLLVTAVLVMVYLITGIGQDQEILSVNLDQRINVPPVQQMNATKQQGEEKILRVAIAGVISPSMTLEHYQELLNYMGRELEMDVRLVLQPTYAEINDLVKSGRVEVAFVCSLDYCIWYPD